MDLIFHKNKSAIFYFTLTANGIYPLSTSEKIMFYSLRVFDVNEHPIYGHDLHK